jgi:type IV secretory pathway TrbD component
MLTTPPITSAPSIDRPVHAAPARPGSVAGTPRRWLRIEGLAAFAAGIALYTWGGGELIWLLPLLLVPDVSMLGYLAGPRAGAFTYNLAHTWAAGVAVLALGLVTTSGVVLLAGAILVAHTGMDRLAGYGVKYPTGFHDTHLGRIGRGAR